MGGAAPLKIEADLRPLCACEVILDFLVFASVVVFDEFVDNAVGFCLHSRLHCLRLVRDRARSSFFPDEERGQGVRHQVERVVE